MFINIAHHVTTYPFSSSTLTDLVKTKFLDNSTAASEIPVDLDESITSIKSTVSLAPFLDQYHSTIQNTPKRRKSIFSMFTRNRRGTRRSKRLSTELRIDDDVVIWDEGEISPKKKKSKILRRLSMKR